MGRVHGHIGVDHHAGLHQHLHAGFTAVGVDVVAHAIHRHGGPALGPHTGEDTVAVLGAQVHHVGAGAFDEHLFVGVG